MFEMLAQVEVNESLAWAIPVILFLLMPLREKVEWVKQNTIILPYLTMLLAMGASYLTLQGSEDFSWKAVIMSGFILGASITWVYDGVGKPLKSAISKNGNKLKVLLLGIFISMAVCGCSGVHLNSAYTSMLNENVILSERDVKQISADEANYDDLCAALNRNAEFFTSLQEGQGLFKGVSLSQKYSSLLQRAVVLAKEDYRRCADKRMKIEQLKEAVIDYNTILRLFQDARYGRK